MCVYTRIYIYIYVCICKSGTEIDTSRYWNLIGHSMLVRRLCYRPAVFFRHLRPISLKFRLYVNFCRSVPSFENLGKLGIPWEINGNKSSQIRQEGGVQLYSLLKLVTFFASIKFSAHNCECRISI